MKYLKRFLIVFFLAFLVACGGGGGSSGANPNQPNLTSTAGDVLTIQAGAFRQYTLSGGVPPYQATSSEPAIAVGNVSGNSLSIGAISGGKAQIRVFDYSGASVSTEVTVGSSVPLYTTAPSVLSVGVNLPARIFSIAGGSPPYRVEGGDGLIALVTQTDATHWSVVGKALGGSFPVSISDSGGSTPIVVQVSTSAPALRVSPDKIKTKSGNEIIVTVSGGQPPYTSAGGIVSSIATSPTVSADGKFLITGLRAGTYDVTFLDSAGQSVKVEVEIVTGSGVFSVSPGAISISENSDQNLTFNLYGFIGDSVGSSGQVCIYVSDPSYFVLDASRSTCSTFSPSLRSFTLVTGSRGSRCVSVNKSITLQIVDSRGNVAALIDPTDANKTLSPSITILDNGIGCNSANALSVMPSFVVVSRGTSTAVQVLGGSGSYSVSSSNTTVATATVVDSVVTITGGSMGGATSVLVIDALTGATSTVSVTSGNAAGALTFSPAAVTVQSGLTNDVTVMGGSGTYTVASTNPSIATVSAVGSTVTVTGGALSGGATVRVTDTSTGMWGDFNVTNTTNTGSLLASPTALFTTTGNIATAVITGGSGRYGVSNVNTAFAETATVSGNTLSVKGGAFTGSVGVIVYDVVTPSSSVTVTVSNTGSLVATPSTVTLPSVGATDTVTVSNGWGLYTAVSRDTTVATVSPASGSGPFTITHVAAGTTSVRFRDSTSGQTVDVAVTAN